MAYDVHLADRVRELLVDGSPVTEQTMPSSPTWSNDAGQSVEGSYPRLGRSQRSTSATGRPRRAA